MKDKILYKEHVHLIKNLSREDNKFLQASIKFVMLTIRRRFSEVKPNCVLSSHQLIGMQYVEDNLDLLHQTVFSNELSLEEKFIKLLPIHGLNLPKVGFVLQLMGEPIGCIDTHNAKKLGIDSNELMINKKSKTLDRDKIWRYIGMCQSREFIGAENMWDSWCNFIALSYPKHFKNGEDVSKRHLTVIKDIYLGR